jgi:hypothetical protein
MMQFCHPLDAQKPPRRRQSHYGHIDTDASRVRKACEIVPGMHGITPLHIAVLGAALTSAVGVIDCTTQQSQSVPTETHATAGTQTMRFYDETTCYNAVKNRWFGLGDYATDQPGR